MLAVFQHQTFCRFSDAEKIQLSDVFHDVDYFKITIRYSKTDQQGEDQFVYLPKSSSPYRNAHMLMCLYIEKMGFEGLASSTDLYLFPPLKWDPSKSEYFVVPGKPVSYSQALTCFKNLLKFANLDYSKYGMHSPRRGGTTDAFVNNVPDFVIDIQGRWKSHQSKYRYVKLTEKDVCKKLANATSYWFCVCCFQHLFTLLCGTLANSHLLRLYGTFAIFYLSLLFFVNPDPDSIMRCLLVHTNYCEMYSSQ
jgi:hypothetical protein